MKIYYCEHYYNESPDDMQDVLVAVLTKEEFEKINGTEDNRTYDEIVKEITHNEYSDNDIMFYFERSDLPKEIGDYTKVNGSNNDTYIFHELEAEYASTK